MGLLDDALGRALPGGDVAKPAMIALAALLVGKMVGAGSSGGAAAAQPSDAAAGAQAGSAGGGGDLLSGLGGLLQTLQTAGHGDTVNSWVGSGQNAPIKPDHLGAALGQGTVQQLSQQAGLNEQDLLAQLSQALPGLVDKLTPNGRLPTAEEAATLARQ